MMKERIHKGFTILGKREGLSGYIAWVYVGDCPLERTAGRVVVIQNPRLRAGARFYDGRWDSGLDAVAAAKKMIDTGEIIKDESGVWLADKGTLFDK